MIAVRRANRAPTDSGPRGCQVDADGRTELGLSSYSLLDSFSVFDAVNTQWLTERGETRSSTSNVRQYWMVSVAERSKERDSAQESIKHSLS